MADVASSPRLRWKSPLGHAELILSLWPAGHQELCGRYGDSSPVYSSGLRDEVLIEETAAHDRPTDEVKAIADDCRARVH
jgi:hypothetical protein